MLRTCYTTPHRPVITPACLPVDSTQLFIIGYLQCFVYKPKVNYVRKCMISRWAILTMTDQLDPHSSVYKWDEPPQYKSLGVVSLKCFAWSVMKRTTAQCSSAWVRCRRRRISCVQWHNKRLQNELLFSFKEYKLWCVTEGLECYSRKTWEFLFHVLYL